MTYHTIKTSSKWDAVSSLARLVEALKADGKQVIRAYLMPEDKPTGIEVYQYCVVIG
jgi:hypothetical protein